LYSRVHFLLSSGIDMFQTIFVPERNVIDVGPECVTRFWSPSATFVSILSAHVTEVIKSCFDAIRYWWSGNLTGYCKFMNTFPCLTAAGTPIWILALSSTEKTAISFSASLFFRQGVEQKENQKWDHCLWRLWFCNSNLVAKIPFVTKEELKSERFCKWWNELTMRQVLCIGGIQQDKNVHLGVLRVGQTALS